MYYNRFLNVARYNLIINRAHYMKMALALFLVLALPFLFLIMKSVWVMAITQSSGIAMDVAPLRGMDTYMPMCFVVAMPVICGYMFHNLLTRQTRLKELTLPASNGEKFLFHGLVTVLGSYLVYVVSFFLIDILQYIFVALVHGLSYAEWIPYARIITPTDYEGVGVWSEMMVILAWLAFCSTFILGNALKYRHNVLWTSLFHVALFFLGMIGMGLLVPFVVANMVEVYAWLNDYTTLWKVILTITILLFIVLCWWMSYRLFRRAQITTVRNK